jgi:2-keto-4-pentenoate hydratase/2-oxohepta-3-ene-1,7-dioic acid hydratase in catechol pathway
MKLCRFQPLVFPAGEVGGGRAKAAGASYPEPRFGFIVGEALQEMTGSIYAGWTLKDRWIPLDQVKLLPPVTPSKIVCVGRNYREHAAEMGNELPKEPLLFFKPPSAIIGPDEPIVLPALSKRVDQEGELAVVIAKRCYRLTERDDVRAYIFGYTCLNDVTARDLQKADVQFTRAKGFDTFCPMGPLIETEFEPAGEKIETRVNGAVRQSAPLADMIFTVDAIIRYVTQVMTLLPGDVISTGTPAGVGPLAAGDVVEVRISGIGSLRNSVMNEKESV